MGQNHWQQVAGVVVPGHRVASGTAPDSPYPASTIALQRPLFKALGLDLDGYFLGTLNLSILPHRFELLAPEVTFRQIEWTDRHPPEDFSFVRCRVALRGDSYAGWIYYPHPETKRRNFQAASVLEILAPPIPALCYGDPAVLEYDPLAIAVV